jgi:dynein heavy chain 2
MVLQQCAHFYNNIATEMIPCQKPMMLAEAVEYEKVREAMLGIKH